MSVGRDNNNVSGKNTKLQIRSNCISIYKCVGESCIYLTYISRHNHELDGNDIRDILTAATYRDVRPNIRNHKTRG